MYILDTNAAYYLVDPTMTPPDKLARLQEKAERKQLEIGLSPITVMELASRIFEEPTDFKLVQDAATTVLSLNPRPLPDPEQRMRELITDSDLARQAYAHWKDILETIARAPDPKALQTGFDDFTTATRRSCDIQRLGRYRRDYEEQYVDDLVGVVRSINPKYDAQVLRAKQTKISPKEQQALATFFKSSEWNATFASMLAHRGGTGVTPKDAGKLAVVFKKAEFFQCAFEDLATSVFCQGHRPNLKHKNDYNDLHQMLFVHDYSTDILVSDDTGCVWTKASKRGKVIPFQEFLNRATS